MIRKMLVAMVVVLVLVMCFVSNIAFADNSTRIAELKQEEQRFWNRIEIHKETVLMSEDDFRRFIRGLENGVVASKAVVKELQAQDIEAKEIKRREAERIAAEEEANKKAEEKIEEVAPEIDEPKEEVVEDETETPNQP